MVNGSYMSKIFPLYCEKWVPLQNTHWNPIPSSDLWMTVQLFGSFWSHSENNNHNNYKKEQHKNGDLKNL